MLADAAIRDLKANLRGPLLRPGDDRYDDARCVWNAMIDRKPALIARCASVADIVTSVNFAREQQLILSVRGGGHNVAGNAVCDGGLMIDLSGFRQVSISPAERIARAEGGATWGVFDRAAQAHGLATTAGFVSTTGIGGLTLGGGLGWLMGEHGLTIDNLLAVDMVTADGKLTRASASENPDLFWAVRGGGGNFGVVTAFEYKLHPVGPMVLAGLVMYPLAKARDMLRYYRDFTPSMSDKLGTLAALLHTPDGAPMLALVLVYHGDIGEGEKYLQPLRTFIPPALDTVAPMAYVDVQCMLDAGNAAGINHYWKSNFLRGLSDEAIDAILDRFRASPNPLNGVAIEVLGNAVGRVAHDATAFEHRAAPYNLLFGGAWTDPAEREACTRWARESWEMLRPSFMGGAYINYLGQEGDEGPDGVKVAYGTTNYQRLAQIKQKYDPGNLFRVNQNIKPTR